MKKFIVGSSLFLTSMAVPAFAVDTSISDLMAAASIGDIAAGVGLVLLAGVAINVLFAGYRYVKKMLNRV